MSVDETARRGFDRAAEAYVRGRPSYPREALAWTLERAGLGPGSIVVDVAAGTGKLTEALLPFELRLSAVEPVAAMRAQLRERLPQVTALEGSAQELPLQDGAVDGILIGQAYHWFAGEPALHELHRVLVPGGHLGLIWNMRDRRQRIWQEIDQIMAPHVGATPRSESGDYRDSLHQTQLFELVAEERFAHRQSVGRPALVDRVGSTSFIAALPEPQHGEVIAAVAELAAREPEPLRLDYETLVLVLRAR